LNPKVPGKFVRITAVVSGDGRTYSGTYRSGTKVWGRKLSDEGMATYHGKVTYRMIELTLAPDGSGQLRVDSRPGPPEADALREDEGTKVGDVAGLKGAEVVRLADGRHRITHDFRRVRDVEDLAGPYNKVDRNQLQARPGAGALVLTPIAQQGKTMAGWDYPRQVKLPLTLRVSLDDFDGDGSVGLILNWPNRTLSANIYGNASDRDTAGRITAFFNPDRTRPDEWEPLLRFRQPPGGLTEQSFRLPAAGPLGDERATPRIGYGARGELKVRRVELTAHLVGYLGIGFAPRGGQVVVSQISEGAGSRSGLRPGDEVKSVDDVPVTTTAELLARVARLAPGGSTTFGVQRDGEMLSARVVAD
jgi:hypothetical protein